jgi:endonuclease-3
MKKKEKVDFVIDKLDKLYPHQEIPLKHQDPFTLLVAVLLSAQSTDAGVNKVTPALFATADTPEKMAQMSVEDIRSIIKPVGLSPTKSKNLHKLANTLVEQYNGQVPDTYEELEALPGVGHKTASVVKLQAFGEPAFPVDTHIHRLIWRWGLSTGKNLEQTEKDCKRLFAQEKWETLHLQIISFGREYCPARGHDPKECPICSVVGRKELFTKTASTTKRKQSK